MARLIGRDKSPRTYVTLKDARTNKSKTITVRLPRDVAERLIHQSLREHEKRLNTSAA